MERRLPNEFLEKLILKGLLLDNYYIASVTSKFKSDFFDNEEISKCFEIICNYFKNYNKIPPRDVVINSFGDSSDIEKVKKVFEEIDSVDYDISNNFDHLFEETNEYLKEKAFKDALWQGIEYLNSGKNPLEYKSVVEDALTKDLKIDLGIDYWKDLKERLERVFKGEYKVPTYFPILDEFLCGGFPAYTLNVFISRVHGFKSTFLANTAARQVLNGYNPLVISLEMSEDAFCQRFDSIYSKQDINRIYLDKYVSKKMISSLEGIKSNHSLGKLIVKEFPSASIGDIESFIRELNYRGIYPNPIYCDYLQLMKGNKNHGDKRHLDIEDVSRGLRQLSFKVQAPVISVCQLNREGMFTSFDDVDFTQVGKGIAISETADFIAIFGRNEDKLVYENELHYKLSKNRIGGRVGERGCFYIDKRSLKMYDSTEFDQWMKDKEISGDEREVYKDKS